MNLNHMTNQPPRGGGGQISHLLHQLSSSRFKDENVVPSVISQTAADEGSRTGMKCPGVMSPFTMPNPSRLECFTPSRCDVSSLVMLCPQVSFNLRTNSCSHQSRICKALFLYKHVNSCSLVYINFYSQHNTLLHSSHIFSQVLF